MASALERYKQLEAERTKLRSEARREALAKAEEAVRELNELGFSYRLVDDAQATSGDGARKGTRTVKDAPCPICGFRTSPPHDARAHRFQGDQKRPFTDEDLAAKGLEKVPDHPV